MRKYFSTYFTYLEKQDKRTRVLLLVATFGLLLFLGLAITLPFKDSLFKNLFPKPPSQAQETKICQTSDAASWKDCGNKINSNLADSIEITTLIICSGPDACAVSLQGVNNRPISIYGTPNSGAGLQRINTYAYPLLSIAGSSNVQVHNVIFDETTTQCPDCGSTIGVSNSNNITFDQVTVLHAKQFGFAFVQNDNVTVKNSKVIDSYIFGIWLAGNPYASKTIHIENNFFSETRVNAVLFNGIAPPENQSTIIGNTFIHNHREAHYKVCGPSGTEPCAGGQLLIEQPTTNLTIENNVIKDGVINPYPNLGASGIEFAAINIHNVTMAGNDIHNNTGAGIVINDGQVNVDGIVIRDNKFYQNRFGDVVFPGATIQNNCTTNNCVTMLKGSIYAYPNPCIIYQGQDRCTATIHWTTNDATNTKVEVGGGGLFSTNPQGAQDASWITAAGATFNLYSGTTLLDSVFVKGIPSNLTPPTPTPTPYPKTTLYPLADTFVEKENPTRNYGNNGNVRVDANPKDTGLLKFDTAPLAGKTIVSAKLRLYVTDASPVQVSLLGAGESWGENGVTWNTKPNIGSLITSIPPSPINAYTEVDITAYVAPRIGQKIAFALNTASTDSFWFATKETTNKPLLVITYR